MAAVARVKVEAIVEENGGRIANQAKRESRFVPGVGNGQRQTVSLTGSAFTALTVPSGAKAVMILLGTAVSLTLKGVTGDTGITIAPASAPIADAFICLPLGATPSIGIANGSASAQSVEVIWF